MSRFIFNYLESQPQGDILKKWSILQENFPFKGTVDVITSDPSFIVSQGSPVNLCVKRDNGDILVFLDEKWLLEILKELAVKSKANALRHFKVDPVLKNRK